MGIFLFLLFVVFPIWISYKIVQGQERPPRIYLEDPESGDMISYRAERVLKRRR